MDSPNAGAAERVTYESAQAIAAAGRGDENGLEKALQDLSAARSELEQIVPKTGNAFAPLALKRAQVFELEIEALLARAESKMDEAIELARQAVELEESIPLDVWTALRRPAIPRATGRAVARYRPSQQGL